MDKEKDKDKNKYPISKNNFSCIGPCFEPGKLITHPMTLEFITNEKDPFCPTEPYTFMDKEGKKHLSYTDVCFKASSQAEQIQNEIDYLNPNIYFDPEAFLKNYYKIKSYDEALEWLQSNKHLPLSTRLRIIECLWTFNKQIYVIDNIIIDSYLDFFIENINKIYNRLHKFIDVNTSNKISFKKNTDDPSKFKVERINYLTEKLVNDTEVNKFLNKYYEKNKDKNYSEMHFQNNEIFKNFINYLESKIEKSL